MSVEEIKRQLGALSAEERRQVSAYLFHLRHSEDPEYKDLIRSRLDDKNPANWVTLEEFERRAEEK